MRTSVAKWGGGGIAVLLGAAACSGTNLHDVGDLNGGAGGAGSSNLGSVAGGSPSSLGGGGSSGPIGLGGSGGSISPGGSGSITPGGSGSSINPPADSAGAGGQPDGEGLVCPTCQPVATGQDVVSVTTNDQNVFWVDYGTTDSLGNYNRDGRLLERGLTGGATSVLADSLAGPEFVAVSSQYAYLYETQRTEANHPFGFLRVPLAGGAVQTLQTPTSTVVSGPSFASAPGYEYWAWVDGAVYRVAETDGAAVEPFIAARGVGQIWSDGALLYFTDPDGLWSAPLTGDAPTQLSSDPVARNTQLLDGDYFYAEETPANALFTGIYLSRMPKAGGAWTRVATATNELIWSQVAVDSDRYFIDEPTDTDRRILQGSFANPTSIITLASESYSENAFWAFQAWTLSSVGIFVGDSTGLYLTPVATP